ncbi:unnamed protein product [Alopecurus aequalis]
MYTLRDFLAFFLGAAITAAVIVLLLPPSLCGVGVVGVVPADQQLASDYGSQPADPNTKNIQTAENGHIDDNLAELLRSAASEDNTVIMAFTNEAWTAPGSLVDIFLESFRVGVKTQPLLKQLVLVAVDAKAFKRCQNVHPLCYSLVTTNDNFTAAQSFMSKDYIDMVWVRNKFMGRVVELGHNVVFTDVDIIWLRNPLLRVPVGADISVSCDWFDWHGDTPYDLNKLANTGFVHVKPSARTSAFFRDWYEARTRCPTCNDQPVFDMVKNELAERHGVTVQFVDTAYLGSQCEPKMDFHNLCTFHANCIIGLDNKQWRLVQVLDEWKKFKAQQELLGSNSTVLVN